MEHRPPEIGYFPKSPAIPTKNEDNRRETNYTVDYVCCLKQEYESHHSNFVSIHFCLMSCFCTDTPFISMAIQETSSELHLLAGTDHSCVQMSHLFPVYYLLSQVHSLYDILLKSAGGPTLSSSSIPTTILLSDLHTISPSPFSGPSTSSSSIKMSPHLLALLPSTIAKSKPTATFPA